MEPSDLSSNVDTDPNTGPKEAQFAISFVKKDEKATVSSSIASQCRRLLSHTDFDLKNFHVYHEDEDRYEIVRDANHFDGGSIVSVKGCIPIESIKINSNPRSNRSYADIISQQKSVNIDND